MSAADETRETSAQHADRLLEAASAARTDRDLVPGVRAAVGIGYAVLAVAEACTRIADAYEAASAGRPTGRWEQ